MDEQHDNIETQKQETLKYFAKQLKKIRKEKNISQAELAKMIGMSSGSIGMYELAQTDPRRSVVLKLANALDVDENYFYDYINKRVVINSTDDLVKVPIRVLGSASCGKGRINDTPAKEYIDLPNTWANEDVYAAYACGESMMGVGIIDGSLVLLKEQCTLENNQLGAFYYNGEEYIKKFKKIGGVILLQSANSNYDDIEVTADDDFRIIGRVIKVITDY